MQPAEASGAAHDATAVTQSSPPAPTLEQLQKHHAEAVATAAGAQRKVDKQRSFLADAEAFAAAALTAVEDAAAALDAEIKRVQQLAEEARVRLAGAEGGA